jgi:DNA-binding PadR family transcriptional regulator
MVRQDTPSKVQLYVLGLLARYGPQHGYQLKQRVNDQVADFARIELGNIYYHLGRMEQAGLVQATREQEGRRPERAVYAITADGERAFEQMLEQALQSEYWAEFTIDAALYFVDRLAAPGRQLGEALARRERKLDDVLAFLREHRDQVLKHIPAPGRVTAAALFRHHELHYEAELSWVRESMQSFERHARSRSRKGKP